MTRPFPWALLVLISPSVSFAQGVSHNAEKKESPRSNLAEVRLGETEQSERFGVPSAAVGLPEQAVEHGARGGNTSEQGCARPQFQVVGGAEDVRRRPALRGSFPISRGPCGHCDPRGLRREAA